MGIEGFTEYDSKDAELYNRYRWWSGLTWGDVLDRASDLYPRKIGLADDRGRLTFGTLRQMVDRLALGLMDLGIEPKDRVMLQVPNWCEFVWAFFALEKIGAIPVLLLPRHNEREILYLAELTAAKAWILPLTYRGIDYKPIIKKVEGQLSNLKHIITVREDQDSSFLRMEELAGETDPTPEDLRRLAGRRPDPMEVSVILPTGGTTGRPKAAPRTHSSFLCMLDFHAKAWEVTSQDTLLTIAPVSHAQGMVCGVGGGFINFSKLVLIDSTDARDICRVIEKERVTAIPTVPTLVLRLVNFDGRHNFDLSSLKKIYSGGAPSSRELVMAVREKLGCAFVKVLGSSEGASTMTRLDDDLEVTCSTVGAKCCPYETYKIIDVHGNALPSNHEGELVIKGPGVFTGYLGSDEENRTLFTPDGFLKTGDLAKVDEAGNYILTGRIKDIILRGGENISAIEIENLISSHELVESVAVIGMPDEELGERICAYVQIRSGAAKLSFEDIIAFLRSIGASVLQLPERIEFVDSLPLTKVGKLDKKALREDIKKRMGIA